MHKLERTNSLIAELADKAYRSVHEIEDRDTVADDVLWGYLNIVLDRYYILNYQLLVLLCKIHNSKLKELYKIGEVDWDYYVRNDDYRKDTNIILVNELTTQFSR